MPEPNRIFRQAALDRLASPEQLDQMMQVATPRSGLALAACCGLVLLAVFWSISGSVPVKISGPGILIQQGGVFVAGARSEGTVFALLVHHGDQVRSNQVLARLSLPELDLRVRHGRSGRDRLRQELEVLQGYHRQEAQDQAEEQAQQLQALESMTRDREAQIKALEERVANLQQLLASENPAVSKVNLLDTQSNLALAKAELSRTRIEMKQVRLNRLQADERRRQQRQDKEFQMLQADQHLESLSELHTLNSEVRSPFDGTVLEIMIKEGQLITANFPIVSLQRAREHLVARLFMPPAEGKRVAPGMSVALALASAKKELHGLMEGRVRWVAPFPARPEALLRVLENQTLVSEFSRQGAPIEVVVELTASPASASGYRWTSGQGTAIPITSGTLCEGTVTLTNHRPISLVLPLFKESVAW